MEQELLDRFIKYAKNLRKDDAGLQKCILLEANVGENLKLRFGFLYVEASLEEIDNHCDQCRNESPLYFALRGDEDLPDYFAASVGLTKYQRIVNGEIPISEKPTDIKMLFDLLERE